MPEAFEPGFVNQPRSKLNLSGLWLAVVGTLFGHSIITQPEVWKHLLLPAVWNVILAAPIFWVSKVTMRRGDRGWAV